MGFRTWRAVSKVSGEEIFRFFVEDVIVDGQALKPAALEGEGEKNAAEARSQPLERRKQVWCLMLFKCSIRWASIKRLEFIRHKHRILRYFMKIKQMEGGDYASLNAGKRVDAADPRPFTSSMHAELRYADQYIQ